MREMKNTNEAQDLKFLTQQHQKKSLDNIRRTSLVRVMWRNLGRFFAAYCLLATPYIYSACQKSESGLIEPTNVSLLCFMALPFVSLKMAPNIGTIGKDMTLIWKTATGNFITGKSLVSKRSNKNITHT